MTHLWIQQLSRRWFAPSPRRSRPRPRVSLHLEQLERRVVPSFLAPVNFTTGNGPRIVTVADVNRDGKPDLIVTNTPDGTVSVLLGNGNGSFQAAQNFSVGVGPEFVAVADLNRDGKLDLVTAN
ncbi:MAG: VCBS repeat-containing protein, partial [Planctomycetes bacterium]|nr:VCBS repeat-containing protein [Planctomycetota bacterium]